MLPFYQTKINFPQEENKKHSVSLCQRRCLSFQFEIKFKVSQVQTAIKDWEIQDFPDVIK